ncbi:MAG: dienelactone hydrolase family protein [SAR324 cluster bacterium]|nr:dienelactone hydrolase family protein [SAR324 cluster bacterium]
MEQKYINLYDEYIHSTMNRRDFLDRLARLAGGSMMALSLLPILESNYAKAETISANDERLETKMVEYAGENGPLKGYLAQPSKITGSLPGVVVIHENRGLHPHIADITRRLALEGFIALAPDALAPKGGTPPDMDQARNMIQELDMNETLNNYVRAVSFLKKLPRSSGKTGCVGFCWGGGLANQLAIHSSDLNASVAFYGKQPASADVPSIKVPIMLHYAGIDDRINQGIPEYVKALDAAKIRYELHQYEGVQHAFNNDTNEARYNAQAAKLAWSRTITFLKANLS